ncbi:hypothetical protein JOH51_002895 [Rhizobium leguminosarum]|nr:hypothetical protein [Rhizobium leguminosarum]
MSFPPSLKRCRKNLDQSISARNRPLANFSGETGIATFTCFLSPGRTLQTSIRSDDIADAKYYYHYEKTHKILEYGFNFRITLFAHAKKQGMNH